MKRNAAKKTFTDVFKSVPFTAIHPTVDRWPSYIARLQTLNGRLLNYPVKKGLGGRKRRNRRAQRAHLLRMEDVAFLTTFGR